jgi:hypothetical protein
MHLNLIFFNMWSIFLKYWKGVGSKTVAVLALGMLFHIILLIVPNLK